MAITLQPCELNGYPEAKAHVSPVRACPGQKRWVLLKELSILCLFIGTIIHRQLLGTSETTQTFYFPMMTSFHLSFLSMFAMHSTVSWSLLRFPPWQACPFTKRDRSGSGLKKKKQSVSSTLQMSFLSTLDALLVATWQLLLVQISPSLWLRKMWGQMFFFCFQ